MRDVHTEHCCLRHGCKYGDDDCTVTTGKAPQSYDCEVCDWEKEDPQYMRIKELEEQLKESDKTAWDHFYIHQEVFNYLLSQGYIDEVVEGDTWEAAAQNIINGIKSIEGKLK